MSTYKQPASSKLPGDCTPDTVGLDAGTADRIAALVDRVFGAQNGTDHYRMAYCGSLNIEPLIVAAPEPVIEPSPRVRREPRVTPRTRNRAPARATFTSAAAP
jgi:hypothetical protein